MSDIKNSQEIDLNSILPLGYMIKNNILLGKVICFKRGSEEMIPVYIKFYRYVIEVIESLKDSFNTLSLLHDCFSNGSKAITLDNWMIYLTDIVKHRNDGQKHINRLCIRLHHLYFVTSTTFIPWSEHVLLKNDPSGYFMSRYEIEINSTVDVRNGRFRHPGGIVLNSLKLDMLLFSVHKLFDLEQNYKDVLSSMEEKLYDLVELQTRIRRRSAGIESSSSSEEDIDLPSSAS